LLFVVVVAIGGGGGDDDVAGVVVAHEVVLVVVAIRPDEVERGLCGRVITSDRFWGFNSTVKYWNLGEYFSRGKNLRVTDVLSSSRGSDREL
jgi:hypothetical protein